MKISIWKRVLPGSMLCMAFSGAIFVCGCSPTVTEQTPEPALSPEPEEAALEWPPEGFSMDAPTVGSVYPHLATGVLTHARLTELPEELLVQADGLAIRAADLDAVLDGAVPYLQEQLRDHLFFALESELANDRLLAHLIGADPSGEPGGEAMQQALRQFFAELTADIAVTDEELAAFYERNIDLAGQAPLAEVEDEFRYRARQEKMYDKIDAFILSVGQQMPVAINAGWVKTQADVIAASDIGKARASGKPTLLSFGSDTCPPCRMMIPIREEVGRKYEGRITMVHVNVEEYPVLGMRYNVENIPHMIMFDADGQEAAARQGPMTVEEIEQHLAALGVEE